MLSFMASKDQPSVNDILTMGVLELPALFGNSFFTGWEQAYFRLVVHADNRRVKSVEHFYWALKNGESVEFGVSLTDLSLSNLLMDFAIYPDNECRTRKELAELVCRIVHEYRQAVRKANPMWNMAEIRDVIVWATAALLDIHPRAAAKREAQDAFFALDGGWLLFGYTLAGYLTQSISNRFPQYADLIHELPSLKELQEFRLIERCASRRSGKISGVRVFGSQDEEIERLLRQVPDLNSMSPQSAPGDEESDFTDNRSTTSRQDDRSPSPTRLWTYSHTVSGNPDPSQVAAPSPAATGRAPVGANYTPADQVFYEENHHYYHHAQHVQHQHQISSAIDTIRRTVINSSETSDAFVMAVQATIPSIPHEALDQFRNELLEHFTIESDGRDTEWYIDQAFLRAARGTLTNWSQYVAQNVRSVSGLNSADESPNQLSRTPIVPQYPVGVNLQRQPVPSNWSLDPAHESVLPEPVQISEEDRVVTRNTPVAFIGPNQLLLERHEQDDLTPQHLKTMVEMGLEDLPDTTPREELYAYEQIHLGGLRLPSYVYTSSDQIMDSLRHLTETILNFDDTTTSEEFDEVESAFVLEVREILSGLSDGRINMLRNAFLPQFSARNLDYLVGECFLTREQLEEALRDSRIAPSSSVAQRMESVWRQTIQDAAQNADQYILRILRDIANRPHPLNQLRGDPEVPSSLMQIFGLQ